MKFNNIKALLNNFYVQMTMILSVVLTLNSTNLVNTVAHEWQFGFQTPASPIAEGIISFHDDLMIFLTLIFFFVVYILYACLEAFVVKTGVGTSVRLVHASTLEIVWTIVPALILVVIAIPSFSLLYSVDEVVEPLYTIKVIGHQWYWSYEVLHSDLLEWAEGSDSEALNTSGSFDSYMLAQEEVNVADYLKAYRLLSVDNHLFIPTETNVRVLVTSSDVLHSWAVPSLGVKLDACPGRLNQLSVFIKRDGIYYGQCSEICGVNHGFMPIGIISYDVTFFGENVSSIEDQIALVQGLLVE